MRLLPPPWRPEPRMPLFKSQSTPNHGSSNIEEEKRVLVGHPRSGSASTAPKTRGTRMRDRCFLGTPILRTPVLWVKKSRFLTPYGRGDQSKRSEAARPRAGPACEGLESSGRPGPTLLMPHSLCTMAFEQGYASSPLDTPSIATNRTRRKRYTRPAHRGDIRSVVTFRSEDGSPSRAYLPIHFHVCD